MTIRLNGEPHELPGPITIADLLGRLDIDPRRVAVEHNLRIVRRERYAETTVGEGDEVEIVNFVGGGAPADRARRPGAERANGGGAPRAVRN